MNSSSSDQYGRNTNALSAPAMFEPTYERAKQMWRDSSMTIKDVTELSDRFWDIYLDASCVADTSAITVLSIHSNLCMGTIASYAEDQPHLRHLLQQLESFYVCGEFMLTELGHGLDARNIETTATLSPDGKSFDLHTPTPSAAKVMPPTTPIRGVPKTAVVFAQLVVEGKLHGVRAFVVPITGGNHMNSGIFVRLLPQRPGTKPLDHAVTAFSHVRLDRSSVLGKIESSEDPRQSFPRQIQRVTVGGLALSLVNIPAMKACAYLAYTFSRQRTVVNPSSQTPVPIISFPTQYGPIISTVAHAMVMEATGRSTAGAFQTLGLPLVLQQALACIFKATVTETAQRHMNELTDRCGWRGLFAFNRISELQLALKGNGIAEGDVLVICIKLASELLQQKFQLPPSPNSNSLLAKHERGLLAELQSFLSQDETGNSTHRSEIFSQNVTPRARGFVQAIGHRIAYDSARSSGLVRRELIDVFESDCVLQDAAWYVENFGVSNREIHRRHTTAIERARPHLPAVIDGFGMEKHFGEAPLVSEMHWEKFMQGLREFGGRDGAVRCKL